MASFSISDRRFFRLFCISLFFLTITGCRGNQLWTNWWTPGDTVDNVGYHPDQPIEYSHKLHAGEKQIPCQYCHSSARRSAHAGIPALNTCMGCHTYVATDKEPIKYITEKYNSNEPVRWVKVHDMPDFVRFSHKPHVLSKTLQENYAEEYAQHDNQSCFLCHGDMKENTTAKQEKSMQMGWCIDCHVTNEAPISCETCHY